MNKIEMRVDKRNGKLILDKNKLKDLASMLDEGKGILTIEINEKPATVKDCIKHYFFLRDKVFEEANPGLTKEELHSQFKEYLFHKIPVDEKYFDLDSADVNDLNDANKFSVRWLTLEGWELYLKFVKAFAWEHYNCFL